MEGIVWCQYVINSVSKAHILSFYCQLHWLRWLMASWDSESLMAFEERWDIQLILCKTNGDTGIDLGKSHAFIHKAMDNGMGRKSTLRSYI